jgi:hypothetical protein
VDALVEAHARYGVALGITKADASVAAVVIDAYKSLVPEAPRSHKEEDAGTPDRWLLPDSNSTRG